jgi:FkbM family methyltransferase
MSLIVSKYQCKGLKFYTRPDSTDQKAIEEVVGRRAYRKRGFMEVNPGDRWLDLGGNIGAFAVSAAAAGAEVRTYEPEPENAGLLRQNLALNGLQAEVVEAAVIQGGAKKQTLWLCKSQRNHYRHTLQPKKGWTGIWVQCLTLDEVLADGWGTAIKLDIEGAELEMLDAGRDWTGISKLVMEYHFDYDRNISKFKERVRKLEAVGFEVRHAKMPDRPTWDYFPAATMVYARR